MSSQCLLVTDGEMKTKNFSMRRKKVNYKTNLLTALLVIDN